MSDRDLERGPQGDHGQDGKVGITGPTGPQGERGRDAKAWRLWPFLRLMAFLLVAAAAIYSSARTYELSERANELSEANRMHVAEIRRIQKQTDKEGVERRHQICVSDEREHLNEVEQLRSTYRYLINLPDTEVSSTFNRFIIAQVPKTERDARTDTAPPFCDEPGKKAEKLYEETNGKKGKPPVGLPEPDPKVPNRPPRVDELIDLLAKQRPQLETMDG